MTRYLIVGLAFLCGGAFADGVPLFTGGTSPLRTDHPIWRSEQAQTKGFVKYHAINLNKKAITASVLSVVIEGKEYVFVGKPERRTYILPADPASSAPQKPPYVMLSWSGRHGTPNDADYGTLSIAIDPTGGTAGIINLRPNRVFTFGHGGFMAEGDAGKGVPMTALELPAIRRPESSASGPRPRAPSSATSGAQK